MSYFDHELPVGISRDSHLINPYGTKENGNIFHEQSLNDAYFPAPTTGGWNYSSPSPDANPYPGSPPGYRTSEQGFEGQAHGLPQTQPILAPEIVARKQLENSARKMGFLSEAWDLHRKKNAPSKVLSIPRYVTYLAFFVALGSAGIEVARAVVSSSFFSNGIFSQVSILMSSIFRGLLAPLGYSFFSFGYLGAFSLGAIQLTGAVLFIQSNFFTKKKIAQPPSPEVVESVMNKAIELYEEARNRNFKK